MTKFGFGQDIGRIIQTAYVVKVYSLPTGHGVMVEKPEETAAILLEAAA